MGLGLGYAYRTVCMDIYTELKLACLETPLDAVETPVKGSSPSTVMPPKRTMPGEG